VYYEALLASALGGDGGRVPLGRARVGVEEIHVPCPLVLWGRVMLIGSVTIKKKRSGKVQNRIRMKSRQQVTDAFSSTFETLNRKKKCRLI
jgi:hypothetical protein